MEIGFRFKEWFHSKVLFLMGLFLLFYKLDNKVNFDIIFIEKLSFVFFYLITAAALGYYINDLFDKKKDSETGKSNFALQHSFIKSILILIIFKIVLFLNWYLLSKNNLIGNLIILQVSMFYIYSLPITRIKEKQFINVFFDATYAFVLPSFIMLFTVFGNYNLVSKKIQLVLFAWTFIVGIRGIFSHYAIDYYNDIKSKTNTFATKYGLKQTKIIGKIYLPILEFVLFLTFLIMVDYKIAMIYFIYFFYITISVNPFKKIKKTNYIYPSLGLVSHYLNQFYTKWFHLAIMIMLILMDYKFSFYIFIFLFLSFSNLKIYIGDILFFKNKLLLPIYSSIYSTIFNIGSFVINYSLYYLFLLFGVDLKEREHKKNEEKLKQENKTVINSISTSRQMVNSEIKTISPDTFSKSIMTTVDEKNINSLWIGKTLSNMELLTIKSFLNNGYNFKLWVYEKIETTLPNNLIIGDANEIIPSDKIFTYQNSSQFESGKGSFAGFSDIFRYKLLYEKGGWWVDMDVTCLAPFDVKTDYFFRAHHDLGLVGNVIKAPKGSELMKKCYEEAISTIDENNTDWHKPINILIDNVKKLRLDKYIYSNMSNTDEFDKLEKYYFGRDNFPENWLFIHWCNEVIRTFNIDKDKYFYNSSFGELLTKHDITKKMTKAEVVKNDTHYKKEILICNLLQVL
jgi:hypothetical protein